MTRNPPASELTVRSLDRVVRSPYRILGLPGHASRAEIHDAAAAARRALKLGANKTTPWDLPLLGSVTRTEHTVQDAIGRLATPVSRLRERLFWFHDADDICSASSPAHLDHIAQRLLSRSDALSLHDGALAMLVATVLQDPLLRQEMRWIEAFQSWLEVVEDDDYWFAVLETEIDGDFEPAATGQEVEALRDEAPRLLGAILTGIARRAIANDVWDIARQALHIFHEADFPSRVVAEAQAEIIGPIEDSFEALCDEVLSECHDNFRDDSVAQNRSACQNALRRFDGEIMLEFQKLVELAGPSSDYSRRTREVAADSLFRLAIAHALAQQFVKAENLLKRARTLAPADSVALGRIEAELLKIAPYARQELISESLSREAASAAPPQTATVQRPQDQKAQPAQPSAQPPSAPQPNAPKKQPAQATTTARPGQKSQRQSGRLRTPLVVLGLAVLALRMIQANPGAFEYFRGVLSAFTQSTPAPAQTVALFTSTPDTKPRPTRTRVPTRTPRPSPSPAPMRYTVQPGDTLGILSHRFDVPMAAILGANPGITDPDKLSSGQQLLFPRTHAAIVAAAEKYFARAAVQLDEKQRKIAAAPASEQAALQAEYERLRRLRNGIVAQYNDYLKKKRS